MKPLSLVLLLSFLPAAPLGAMDDSDWPQFQGPHRNGTSGESNLNLTWGENGPKVLLTTELGPGFGGAAIEGDEVYLLDRIAEEKDVLRCLDLNTSSETWRHAYEARGRLDYPGSRGVPAVTGERVFTIGGFGHVMSVDRKTHEPVWKIDLRERYDAHVPQWGWAQSPLLYESFVIVAPLAEEAGMAALDQGTGEEIWRSTGVGTTHSTPTLLSVQGRDQVLLVSTKGRDGLITSVDAKTGEVLWQFGDYFCRFPITAPIRIDDERIFVTGGYDAGSLMLQVDHGESGWSVKELYRMEKGSQVHLPILVGDHLYMMANESGNSSPRRQEDGGLMCFDLQGKTKWRTGANPYFGRGNLIYAGGKLIAQDGFSGILRIIEPSTERYRAIAEANIFGTETDQDLHMWAPMALSSGRLLMRSQDRLVCLDLRASQ